MFTKSTSRVLILGFILSVVFSLFSFIKVEAAYPAGCSEPFGIPLACPRQCASQNDTGCYVPDFQCTNAKFLDRQTVCCDNKCIGDVGDGGDQGDLIRSFNVFGTKFSFSVNKIPNLINVAITTFLGIVSAYALIRGMYIGAVLRSQAITPEDIGKVNKEIINLIIGFVLAWSFIFIIQFISSVIGIGDLNDLNVTNTGTEIIIQ